MSKIFHCAIFILKKNYALNRCRMGNEVLTGWAESRVEKAGEALPSEEKTVRSGKKKFVGTARSVRLT
ncbi:MAG: hypothetical protein V8K32_02890 [Candidatus Electrothrix gigas]